MDEILHHLRDPGMPNQQWFPMYYHVRQHPTGIALWDLDFVPWQGTAAAVLDQHFAVEVWGLGTWQVTSMRHARRKEC